MKNQEILCDDREKNKPTVRKPIKNIKVSNGAERSKPTVSEEQSQKQTDKK